MTEPLALPARLDSAAAVQLAQTLAERQGEDVVVDAAAVEHLGALGMQTLLVAASAWRAVGKDLSVINISAKVRSQFADLGLSDTSLLEGAAP